MIPLNIRIRAEILRTEFGFSLGSVAERCGVSKASVAAWTAEGRRSPRTCAQRGPRGFHDTIAKTISKAVNEQPLTTATQLRDLIRTHTNRTVSCTTVYKSLKLLKLTHKTASRSREHQPVAIGHPFFQEDPYTDDAMMFDESGFYMNDLPRKGWSLKGTRVPKGKPSARRRLSLLLVTDRNGIVARRILAGGVKGEHVAAFISELPNGRPLILDNASVHKTKEVQALCTRKRIKLNFLPPYSPWYNPVENAFAQAKLLFRQLRVTVSGDLEGDIVASVMRIRSFLGMFESSKAMWQADREFARVRTP